MARIEVINGVDRRRRWSLAEKQALVAASYAPGAVVRELARRADIRPNQIYRWRHEFGHARAGFTPVVMAPTTASATVGGALPVATQMIEVDLGGSVRVRIPSSASAELAAAVVSVLVGGKQP